MKGYFICSDILFSGLDHTLVKKDSFIEQLYIKSHDCLRKASLVPSQEFTVSRFLKKKVQIILHATLTLVQKTKFISTLIFVNFEKYDLQNYSY